MSSLAWLSTVVFQLNLKSTLFATVLRFLLAPLVVSLTTLSGATLTSQASRRSSLMKLTRCSSLVSKKTSRRSCRRCVNSRAKTCRSVCFQRLCHHGSEMSLISTWRETLLRWTSLKTWKIRLRAKFSTSWSTVLLIRGSQLWLTFWRHMVALESQLCSPRPKQTRILCSLLIKSNRMLKWCMVTSPKINVRSRSKGTRKESSAVSSLQMLHPEA